MSQRELNSLLSLKGFAHEEKAQATEEKAIEIFRRSNRGKSPPRPVRAAARAGLTPIERINADTSLSKGEKASRILLLAVDQEAAKIEAKEAANRRRQAIRDRETKRQQSEEKQERVEYLRRRGLRNAKRSPHTAEGSRGIANEAARIALEQTKNRLATGAIGQALDRSLVTSRLKALTAPAKPLKDEPDSPPYSPPPPVKLQGSRAQAQRTASSASSAAPARSRKRARSAPSDEDEEEDEDEQSSDDSSEGIEEAKRLRAARAGAKKKAAAAARAASQSPAVDLGPRSLDAPDASSATGAHARLLASALTPPDSPLTPEEVDEPPAPEVRYRESSSALRQKLKEADEFLAQANAALVKARDKHPARGTEAARKRERHIAALGPIVDKARRNSASLAIALNNALFCEADPSTLRVWAKEDAATAAASEEKAAAAATASAAALRRVAAQLH